MPHFEIRYSSNLESHVDMQGLCEAVAHAMRAIDLFETGGIRVRAFACDHFVVADGHEENACLDMTLRIGAGRSQDAKKAAGDRLFAVVADYVSPLFDRPHLALSLEMQEIDPVLSWKKNSIHPRLRAQAKGRA